MNRIKILWMLLTVLAATTGGLLAQAPARVVGNVVDAAGDGIEGVTVVIRGVETDYQEVLETDKKGRFKAALVDATRQYEISLQKEGYQPRTEPLPVAPGETLRMDWSLASGPSPEEISRANEAINAFNEGAKAANAGDLVTARTKFLEALEINPELEVAYGAVAGVYIREGSYREAADAASRALTSEPESPPLLNIAFEAYSMLGEMAQANEVKAKLVELGMTKDVVAMIYNQGAEAARAGDITTALARFQDAADLDPTLAAPWSGLAIAHLNNQNFAESAKACEKWVEIEPTNLRALQMRYDAYRFAGDTANAATALDALVRQNPEAVADKLLEQALQLFNRNAFADARAIAAKILEVQPDQPRAHYVMGLCLVNAGDIVNGKKHLLRFAELAPDDPDASTATQMARAL